jgi:multiple sugar transport system substrate-binding protein
MRPSVVSPIILDSDIPRQPPHPARYASPLPQGQGGEGIVKNYAGQDTSVVLRGITWNHSRALPPLAATAQRFEELHPEVEIQWEKRSLHEFGHAGLVPLAERYDLLVIDHPMMGAAHQSRALLDLKRVVEQPFLEELASDSVGRSYESYCYEQSLYALPIDAAAPAASFRPDLLERSGVPVPRTWNDLLDLARKKLVVMPGFHADVFLNFMGLYVSRQAAVGEHPDEFLDRESAKQCLEELRELAGYMPEVIYEWNPIALYETLAVSDKYAYCPFAFSYSNYARAGFAEHLILFADPVVLDNGHAVCTVLGGTGMAISARCKSVEIAVEYLTQVAGAEWQRTVYALSGGQPARRLAWKDETLNLIAHGFFEQTLNSMEAAYVRPRYPGYVEFQAMAGAPIVEYLRSGGSVAGVVEKLNELYRQSQ